MSADRNPTITERAEAVAWLRDEVRGGPYGKVGGWTHALPPEARDAIRLLVGVADGGRSLVLSDSEARLFLAAAGIEVDAGVTPVGGAR